MPERTHDRGHARRLERDVDALASGELPHRIDRIGRRGVDDVGCPEPSGEIELGRHHVHRDDAFGACDPRALQGRQPDAAEADHGDRGTGADPGGVDRGADAGGDAASQQADAGQIGLSGQPDGLHGVDDGVGGERPQGECAGDGLAGRYPPDPRRLLPRVRASAWTVSKARSARAARNGPGE